MNFATFTPSSINFENSVVSSLQGTGILTVGGISCPELFFDSSSTGQWQDGTTVNFAGDLELGGTGGTATFSTITGTGNLTVDQGITCNLTAANTSWTSSLVTVDGTLNLANGTCVPNTPLILGNGTGAQLNLTGPSDSSQTLENITNGTGSVINFYNTVKHLTISNASGTCSTVINGTHPGSTIVIDSPSTYVLDGTGHTFQGQMHLISGILQAGVDGALPPAEYVFADAAGVILDLNGTSNTVRALEGGGSSGGNITLSSAGSAGSLNIQDTLGASYTYNGIISDSAGPAGSITTNINLILTGANTYQGGTLIEGRILQVSRQDNLGSPAAGTYFLTFSSGGFQPTLHPLADFDLSAGPGLGINLAADGYIDTTTSSMTISAPITGSGSLIKQGSNTLTFSGSNNYSGLTTINSGTLQAGAANAFSPNSAISLADTAGANLSLSTFDQTIPSLSGGGANGGNVLLGSATLTQTGTYGIYSGSIQGTGGLTLSGSGTFQLNGTNNTYSGTTTINSGTLQAGAVKALSSRSIISIANAAGGNSFLK